MERELSYDRAKGFNDEAYNEGWYAAKDGEDEPPYQPHRALNRAAARGFRHYQRDEAMFGGNIERTNCLEVY